MISVVEKAENRGLCEDMLVLLGWSKAELARRLGLHVNAVSRWGGVWPRYAEAYLELAVMLWECGEKVKRR